MDHEGVTQSADKDDANYVNVKRPGLSTGLTHILHELGIFMNLPDLMGVIDPTPQPLGCPLFVGRAGESGEARAFRRFPITAHKRGPG